MMNNRKRVTLLWLALMLGATNLFVGAPVQAEPINLIANPSVETAANASTPQSWQSSKWGTNTATFAYLGEGHTGSRSVKTTVTNFTDGDAKWFFTPVTVQGTKTYQFSDYYKSNTETELVVRYTHQGGTFSYAWLGSADASSTWSLINHEFTAPTNATQATVFHLVSSVGWLILDDADLREIEPPLPGGNIVLNPSVEQTIPGNPNLPNKWQSNKWGVNTATFAYLNEGHTGSRSVRAEITAYTDGDAKWYFDPVAVEANSPYTFSDYYKSSTETQIIVRYTNGAGAHSYEWLGNTPTAATWQQASFGFTPPAGTQNVSVFHIVSSVGWLVIDDASVAETPPANPVLNPSVEFASATDPTKPDAWIQDAWGDNAATFEYVNEGHTGNRSVKVTVNNRVDGDAKWHPEELNLEPGSYKFTAWYKTNTTPHVVARHTKTDGSHNYLELREPYPNANSVTEWQHYEESFTVPVNTQSTTLFFFVDSNGWLQTDDYAIDPYVSTGFARPLVSLTFDDSFIDNVDTALPAMDTYGFKSTQCYGTAFVEAVPEGEPAVHTFYNGGHEICSHTVTHPFLTQLSVQDVQYELTHSQDILEAIIGAPVVNFASPYGDYNYLVNQQIKQLYRSHRTVDEGFNSKDNFDVERIMVQNMLVDTTLQEFQGWLDHAKATNTWLVLVYHRVTSATDIEPFDTQEEDFVDQMAALNTSGITVKTYNGALDELLPQL